MKYSCDIVLMVAPFWTPMIPPMGICRIKSYLEKHNFKVKSINLNVDEDIRIFYKEYFDLIDKHILENAAFSLKGQDNVNEYTTDLNIL